MKGFALLFLLLATTAALAQAPTRVRGASFVPGTRADLKPGATIFAGARAEGDKLVAPRIVVRKDAVHPPQ